MESTILGIIIFALCLLICGVIGSVISFIVIRKKYKETNLEVYKKKEKTILFSSLVIIAVSFVLILVGAFTYHDPNAVHLSKKDYQVKLLNEGDTYTSDSDRTDSFALHSDNSLKVTYKFKIGKMIKLRLSNNKYSKIQKKGNGRYDVVVSLKNKDQDSNIVTLTAYSIKKKVRVIDLEVENDSDYYVKKMQAQEKKNQKSSSDSDDTDDTGLDSSTYTDDMKDAINDKLSDDISIKKVTVSGQFDAKPASMMVSAYSDDFYEDHSKDYVYIIDMIKVIKKYSPSDFDNIKVALYGKVGTPYETKYMPVQSYSLPGNVVKKVIPDNLTKNSLEAISTDHYYAKFSD